VLLKDGQIAISTEAGGDATFTLTLSGISPGSYVFSVYGTDSSGNNSVPLSFPITLSAGSQTGIGGVFVAPTIDADKSAVRQGDNITFFGLAAPTSNVVISVHSATQVFLQALSDATGVYSYTYDTSALETGSHVAESKAVLPGAASDYGAGVSFTVGDTDVIKPKKTCSIIGDLNHDCRVNLTDFSILVYWYKRPLTGTGVQDDLNHDGKVDLTDFSILVSHWTG
jgi:hypothetical protein